MKALRHVFRKMTFLTVLFLLAFCGQILYTVNVAKKGKRLRKLLNEDESHKEPLYETLKKRLEMRMEGVYASDGVGNPAAFA